MKKKALLLVFSFALGIIGFMGCGAEEKPTETDGGKKEEIVRSEAFSGAAVVDAEYVKENLEQIILIDARGEEAAAKKTIKGAITTTWQYLATCEDGKPGDENWGCILDPERLSERLGELGLSQDKEIVLFSNAQDGWGEDGRIAWELFAAGYKEVKIVDGGIDAMVEAGLETQKGAEIPVPTEVKIDTIDETHIINTKELADNIEEYKIVDVRTDEEYEGQVLYGEAKGGRIPGAIQIRYTDLFNEDHTIKSNEEIIALYEEAGIMKEDKIVTYCTSGIRSAYAQVILEMCGFENVKNYDESYKRWCIVEDVESEK